MARFEYATDSMIECDENLKHSSSSCPIIRTPARYLIEDSMRKEKIPNQLVCPQIDGNHLLVEPQASGFGNVPVHRHNFLTPTPSHAADV